MLVALFEGSSPIPAFPDAVMELSVVVHPEISAPSTKTVRLEPYILKANR